MRHLDVCFRRETAGDLPFLLRLFTVTPESEMTTAGWDSKSAREFLEQQFRSREAHYRTVFKDADFQILEIEDRPVGRLAVERTNEEIHVVDLALLPEYRRQGIGTRLLRALQQESQRTGKRLWLEVIEELRALPFYDRLGFRRGAQAGLHLILEWLPAPGQR